MDHKLRATLFFEETLLYCSCRNFFRVVSNDTTAQDIEQMFSVHKWAWDDYNIERRINRRATAKETVTGYEPSG